MSYAVGSGAAAAAALTPRTAAAGKIEKVARGKATRDHLKKKAVDDGDGAPDELAAIARQTSSIASELDAPRPVLRLRSFGSPLSIKLVLHEKKSHRAGVPMLVEARDSLNFKGLLRWVQITVFGIEKPDAQSKLTLRYVDAAGSEQPLTNNNQVADYFDAMWCVLSELHVYDEGCKPAVATSIDWPSRLFALIDEDGNGELDVHETLRVQRLCIAREASHHSAVSQLLQHAFAKADVNEDSIISKQEFTDVFSRFDQSFIAGLLKRPDYRMRALEASALSASTWRVTLGDVERVGRLVLDATAAVDYGISLQFTSHARTRTHPHTRAHTLTHVHTPSYTRTHAPRVERGLPA